VADVDVVGPDGRVLVAVEGFTMRRIDPVVFDEGLAAAPVPPREVAGIDPAVGTDMLMTLLSARTPEQVVVRPHRDGKPVPLPAADTRPSTGSADEEVGSDRVLVLSPRAAEAVPAPAAVAPPLTAPAIAPDHQRPVVERMRELWARTLGTDEIGLDDDFFDRGGNSLTAIELMSQIRELFDVELTVGFLFETPTLAELTDVVERRVRQ
jgi:acyl carrier protein